MGGETIEEKMIISRLDHERFLHKVIKLRHIIERLAGQDSLNLLKFQTLGIFYLGSNHAKPCDNILWNTVSG